LVPHPTKANAYVSAEGNRRICALKLLANPAKAATEKDKRHFRKLSEQLAQPIDLVNAVVFDAKSESRPWVGLRHDPAQPKGVGTKPWKAEQSTRFNLAGDGRRSPNAQALLLLDHARSRGLLTSDELDEIGLTTLTRYVSSPKVRFALGLVDGKSNQINVPIDEFDRALSVFLRDALGDAPAVHSRATAKHRSEYADALHATGVAPVTRGLDPYVPDDRAPQSEAESQNTAPVETAAKAGKRNRRDRNTDRYIVPAGYAAPIPDPAFRRIFQEARSLPARQHRFCATYLVRALVEQAAALFLRHHQIQPVPQDFGDKLQALLRKLQGQGFTGPGLQALRKICSGRDTPYSPHTLGLYIHGGQIPSETYALEAWDTYERIMSEIVRQLTSGSGQAQP
jgi:hypothetical protein